MHERAQSCIPGARSQSPSFVRSPSRSGGREELDFSTAVRLANSKNSRTFPGRTGASNTLRPRPETAGGITKARPTSLSITTDEEMSMEAFKDLPVTPIRNSTVLRRRHHLQNDPWSEIDHVQSVEHHLSEERKKDDERRRIVEYARDLQSQVDFRRERSQALRVEEDRLLREMEEAMNAQAIQREKEQRAKQRVRRGQLSTWAVEAEEAKDRRRVHKLRDLREDYMATKRTTMEIERERRRVAEKRKKQKMFYDQVSRDNEDKIARQRLERERRLQEERENPDVVPLHEKNKMSPQQKAKLAAEWASTSRAEKDRARQAMHEEELRFQTVLQEEDHRKVESSKRKAEKRKKMLLDNQQFLDYQKTLRHEERLRKLQEKNDLAAAIRQKDELDKEAERRKELQHRRKCKTHQMSLVQQIQDDTHRKDSVAAMSPQERQLNRKFLERAAMLGSTPMRDFQGR